MKSILVIDDDKDVLELTKSRLEKQGYQIFTSENGFDGFKQACENKPNLILLDIVMPGKDGFAVLRELSASDLTWDIPVIMLTAKGDTNFIIESKELGAADYFIKPFDWNEFTKHIKRFLGAASEWEE